jgi:hypothetical protein
MIIILLILLIPFDCVIIVVVDVEILPVNSVVIWAVNLVVILIMLSENWLLGLQQQKNLTRKWIVNSVTKNFILIYM